MMGRLHSYHLAFGTGNLAIHIPDGISVTAIAPCHAGVVENPSEALKKALKRPISSPRLRHIAKSSDMVCIVLNDVTRATPNRLFVDVLLRELEHVPDRQIRVLLATGTHRPATVSELQGMLGADLLRRFAVIQNDAYDDTHIRIGTTRDGTPVFICREFVESDVRVVTGCIEPHFFAGFSGGAKAILPGLASIASIAANHNPANIDHPAARWGVRWGNPVFEGILEAGRMAEPVFLVNATLNHRKAITGFFVGRMEEAHSNGCVAAAKIRMADLAEECDIVVVSSGGFPGDINLYQSVKGMSAASNAVKPGGTILLATECRDGIPDGGEYSRLLASAPDLDTLLHDIRTSGTYRPEAWQVQAQAMACQRATVLVHSDHLSREELGRAHLGYAEDIGAAARGLIERYGAAVRVCIMPYGPLIVPRVTESRAATGLAS